MTPAHDSVTEYSLWFLFCSHVTQVYIFPVLSGKGYICELCFSCISYRQYESRRTERHSKEKKYWSLYSK